MRGSKFRSPIALVLRALLVGCAVAVGLLRPASAVDVDRALALVTKTLSETLANYTTVSERAAAVTRRENLLCSEDGALADMEMLIPITATAQSFRRWVEDKNKAGPAVLSNAVRAATEQMEAATISAYFLLGDAYRQGGCATGARTIFELVAEFLAGPIYEEARQKAAHELEQLR